MKRVYAGVSGGVDSALSAALLKAEGHQVTGVFIKIWQPEFIECSWREDRLDAMRVCAQLDIPYREIDLSDEYKKGVVDHMVRSYERGLTPNPDVLCNTAIKFGVFMKWALTEGAECVATGHYAREENGTLLKGVDTSKDQSYFLHQLTSDQLQMIRFPIGVLHKEEVRARARSLGLAVAAKPDSQGLCFVGDVSLPEFLSHYVALTPGSVVNELGETIGEHDGAVCYTVGQRHGFRISQSSGSTRPHYVSKIDAENNTIVVSEQLAAATALSVYVSEMHWIGDAPQLPRHFSVQARYRESPVRARLSPDSSGVRIDFEHPHIAAPGQSLVVYDDERCLGGGAISHSLLNT